MSCHNTHTVHVLSTGSVIGTFPANPLSDRLNSYSSCLSIRRSASFWSFFVRRDTVLSFPHRPFCHLQEPLIAPPVLLFSSSSLPLLTSAPRRAWRVIRMRVYSQHRLLLLLQKKEKNSVWSNRETETRLALFVSGRGDRRQKTRTLGTEKPTCMSYCGSSASWGIHGQTLSVLFGDGKQTCTETGELLEQNEEQGEQFFSGDVQVLRELQKKKKKKEDGLPKVVKACASYGPFGGTKRWRMRMTGDWETRGARGFLSFFLVSRPSHQYATYVYS